MLVIGANDLDGNETDHIIMQYKDLVKSVLFPVEKCQCAATNTCYHILAAKKSLGMDIVSKTKCVDLSLLIKKKKPKANKKTGRKQPKRLDFVYEFAAAPDSELNLTSTPKTPKIHEISFSSVHSAKEYSPSSNNRSINKGIHVSEVYETPVKRVNPPDTPKSILKGSRANKKRVNINLDFNENFSDDSLSDFNKCDSVKRRKVDHDEIESEDYNIKLNSETNSEKPTVTLSPTHNQRKMRYWVESLDLTIQNKREIQNYKFLSDNHMRAALKLLQTQFPNIGGMEDTLKCPVFVKKEDRWKIPLGGFSKCQGPSLQIHYTGHSHWLLSVKCEDGNFYLIDSMHAAKLRLTSALEIQLCEIYDTGLSNLIVSVINPVLQTNTYDCGLYAIANAIEFATNRLHFWLQTSKCEWIYNEELMRKHLIHCFETGVLKPFPKLKKKVPSNLKVTKHEIVLNCPCRYPDYLHKSMISCSMCQTWWHKKCADISSSVEDFLCNICTGL